MTTLHEMWVRLAQHQPYADANGYGPAWAKMCKKQTAKAASAAWDAARASGAASEDAVEITEEANWAVNAAAAAWSAVRASRAEVAAAAKKALEAAEAIRYIEKAKQIYDAKEPTK